MFTETELMLLVCCPKCGKIIIKAGDGTTAEHICHKCRAKLHIAVAGAELTVSVVEGTQVKPQLPQ